MRRLIALFILSVTLPGLALAQLNQVLGDQDEVDQSRAVMEQLESQIGRLDPRMIEPLQQYSRELMAAEMYSDAHMALDQIVQIIRVEEGLYSSEQFPYLLSRIEAYGNQGNWGAAREMMEHVGWLINRPENQVDEGLLDTLRTLSELHRWGVAHDAMAAQRYHFVAAQNLTTTAIQVAGSIWGEDDSRLASLMYERLLQYYQQAAIVDRGGATALDLRSSPFGGARSRRDMMNSYFFAGLRQLNAIRGQFLQQELISLEALALTDMYIADWNVLFNDPEAAAVAYRSSNELLLRAGISQASIDLFFASPKMLPAPTFLSSWQSALSTMERDGEGIELPAQTASFSFRQWSAQFPHVMAPETAPSYSQQNSASDYALFSFTLNGLEEVSRWYRGRLKKSVSIPDDLQVVEQRFSRPVEWIDIEDLVLNFRFRPKLVEGVPQDSSATLFYQLAN